MSRDTEQSNTAETMGAEPIRADLFRVDPDGGLTLLGGWSATGNAYHFPRQPYCPYSGADDVEPVELPRRGSVCWWTTVRSAPPGYSGPVPYVLAVIQLDVDPLLRVIGRVLADTDAGDLRPGTGVASVGEVIETPDGPRTTWAFTRTDPPSTSSPSGAR